MFFDHLHDALRSLEKTNAELDPDLLSVADARSAWATCARAKNLIAYIETSLARRLDDAEELARVSGTSVAKARQTLETGKALQDSDVVRDALAGGSISFDQAAEIVKAEKAAPGAADELLRVASCESFQVLRERSRRVVLEAEQGRDLAQRQKEARGARHFTDELGMRNIHLKLPPVLGEAICNRAETEAQRLHRSAKSEGRAEPFERHLADAFAKMLSGSEVKGHCRRADVTVLVSYEVAKRNWTEVREGEVCKIPGLGPVSPQVAKEIAADAFLSGVFFAGKDLRQFKTFGRHARAEVRRALELGEPPGFDGIRCTECGARFRNQRDHLEPVAAEGPSSTGNLGWKCYRCHQIKTAQDRKAGKLTPREPQPGSRPQRAVPAKERTRQRAVRRTKRGPPVKRGG
jgi:hypothetical protein